MALEPAVGLEPTTCGLIAPSLMEPTIGIEPITYGLRYRCSTN